jgi:O-antigen/teichoic acid export membrane protein
VVLRALGIEDYGINNVVGGFVSMFSFLNTSMSNGIQRFYNFKLGKEGEQALTRVYNTALLIQMIIAVIIVVLLETVGFWYVHNKMVIPAERLGTALWIYQFAILSLVLVIMQIPYSAAIIAHERMDYYACVSIIDVMLKLAFALYLPYVHHDRLLIYGGFGLCVMVINFLLYFIYCKKKFKEIHLKIGYHKGLFKDMLSFSGWNIFGTFAYMLKGQGLNVLLNAFFGPVVNAARGVSMMIGNAIQGFQSNIVVSFRPQTVQSYAEGDIIRVRKLMYSLSKVSYLMLFMLSMPVVIELPDILHLWLGDVVPEYTIPFTILILAVMILSSLNTPLSQVVHATGKMRNYQMGTSIIICAILPIAWVVLKMGGNPTSVYVVSIIMTIINQGVCMILLKRVFPYSIRDYLKEVILPCFLVTVIAAVLPLGLHFLLPSTFFRLIIVALVGVSSTALISYYLIMNQTERQLVLDFVHKFLRKK